MFAPTSSITSTDAGEVLGARGVVVVDVHLHAGPGGDLGERADAVAPPGVDEDDPGDLRRVERAQPRHPVAARRGLEVLAQRPLLRAGEDELRPRVELLRRHHRGERVELGLQVGGDDLHGRLYASAICGGPDVADLQSLERGQFQICPQRHADGDIPSAPPLRQHVPRIVRFLQCSLTPPEFLDIAWPPFLR